MPKTKNAAVTRIWVKKGASLKDIYAQVKRSFTAADLQAFTEIDEGIPAEEVAAKLEAMAQKSTRKRKKREMRP